LIGITILGSTGTIGENTLDVIGRNREKCRVLALGANVNHRRMAEQCAKWRPEAAAMADPDAAEKLRTTLLAGGITDIEVLSGVEGLARVAARNNVTTVMAAIVGAAGLEPTLAAVRAGKRVLLASKEVLVMSGKLFMDATRESRAELLPIDSEHNAIFQCMPAGFLPGHSRSGDEAQSLGVRRILLTASGGPFRDLPPEAFDAITPEQACAHPNWVMGKKISVDSATMMNKGLELIEACWLFDADIDDIEVVLHPQSVVHSMVQYVDGSVLAQLGNPDMRTPIAYALAWPERMDAGVEALDLFEVARLDFMRADEVRFPCLRLAREAMRAGGTTTAVLNAANEVAVQAFLDERLSFDRIPQVIERTLSAVAGHEADSLDTILEDDRAARDYADRQVAETVR